MATKLPQRSRAARFPRNPRQRVFTQLGPQVDVFDLEDDFLVLRPLPVQLWLPLDDFFPPLDADPYPETLRELLEYRAKLLGDIEDRVTAKAIPTEKLKMAPAASRFVN